MSYRKIFSVVNEQTASTVMARYAISLAAACKSALVLYAAHDEGSDEALLRHTDRHWTISLLLLLSWISP